MAKKTFEVGDQVVLRSGGPTMTVEQAGGMGLPGQVQCQWFAGAKLNTGWFAVDSLDPAPPKKKPE